MGQLNKDNLIIRLTFEFSLQVIIYAEELELLKKFVISRQLLRSGTSIGASVFEAQNAESLPDFIHKMKIASKEAGETLYWLGLCQASENYPSCQHLLDSCGNIQKVLSRIIATSKLKLKSPN